MQKKLEIVDVIGREIVDSRGNPTVEAEGVAKYNQLLRIEEDLGCAAEYPGKGAFNRD